MPITSRLSELFDFGWAKETAFGSALAATNWAKCKDFGMAPDPKVILPTLLRSTRAGYTEALPGIQRNSGNVVLPLYPDAGVMLLAGAIGSDAAQTGSSPTNSTTLASQAVAGATSISSTATFANNSVIQIDSNASGIAELRTVTSVTGSGPYTISFSGPLKNTHASAATVANVAAPYTHTINVANALPSFTLEGNYNGADLQYAGGVINKADIKLAMNAEAEVTYAFEAQQHAYLGSPSTPVWPTDVAMAPPGFTASIGGDQDLSISTFDLSIDNGVKVYDTFAGQNYPSTILPTERKVTAKVTAFLQNVTGGLSQFDYFSELALSGGAVQTQAVVLTIAQNTYNLVITLPAAAITKFTPKVKRGDVVMVDVDFAAIMGGANNVDISATATNGDMASY